MINQCFLVKLQIIPETINFLNSKSWLKLGGKFSFIYEYKLFLKPDSIIIRVKNKSKNKQKRVWIFCYDNYNSYF